MVRLKAKLLKGGVLEIGGLEQLIDSKLAEFKKALGMKAPAAVKPVEYVRPAPKKTAKKVVAAAKSAKAKPAAATDDAFGVVMAALAKHPAKAHLIRAGSQPDQLLRSLIPLYLAQESGVEVTSGTITAFWKKHGVKFAAPNAAKALREHVGYARATKAGRQITPNGIKYVEAALQKKAA
ncbi:MAG: hypothetical protein ACJ790_21425 [Myxococcaceae bacterium]